MNDLLSSKVRVNIHPAAAGGVQTLNTSPPRTVVTLHGYESGQPGWNERLEEQIDKYPHKVVVMAEMGTYGYDSQDGQVGRGMLAIPSGTDIYGSQPLTQFASILITEGYGKSTLQNLTIDNLVLKTPTRDVTDALLVGCSVETLVVSDGCQVELANCQVKTLRSGGRTLVRQSEVKFASVHNVPDEFSGTLDVYHSSIGDVVCEDSGSTEIRNSEVRRLSILPNSESSVTIANSSVRNATFSGGTSVICQSEICGTWSVDNAARLAITNCAPSYGFYSWSLRNDSADADVVIRGTPLETRLRPEHGRSRFTLTNPQLRGLWAIGRDVDAVAVFEPDSDSRRNPKDMSYAAYEPPIPSKSAVLEGPSIWREAERSLCPGRTARYNEVTYPVSIRIQAPDWLTSRGE